MKRALLPLSLLLVAVLTLALRALPAPTVFPGDGQVDLVVGDSAYHARRALFSFVNFPSVLLVDPYMGYPDGAAVPMPPLYDWALGGVARLFGDSEAVFERVAAWLGPLLAVLTLLPVYGAGRRVGGPGAGLGAALFFAVLPAGARASLVGDVDHHAALTLLGATLLALSLALVRPGVGGRRLAAVCGAMSLVRAALVLSWSGSLLYLGLAEGALLLVGVLEGRRAVLWGQAAGCLGAALLLLPWLASLDAALAPGFSSTNLSWLHPLWLLVVAGVATGVGALAAAPARGVGARVAVAAGLGLLLGGIALLAFPELRVALVPAFDFFAKQDSWGPRNLEQQPLFFPTLAEPERWTPLSQRLFGFWAYAIPLALLAVLERLRDPAVRSAALVLACWTAGLGLLAVLQVRFASDFAPAASIGFALLLRGLARLAARGVPRWLATAAAVALAGALLWPGLETTYLRQVPRLLDWLRPAAAGSTAPLGDGPSLVRFARSIRAVTPETSGYFDADGRPEYGVLCKPSHGHNIHYWSRRATPANNFGPYLDEAKYLAASAFYLVRAEQPAVAIARRLGARYVMTYAHENATPEHFADRLHGWDGTGPAPAAPSRRFRLVTEGPRNGKPRLTAFPSGRFPLDVIPYKLFERVRGAILEGSAPPGSELVAEVWIETPLPRRFRYRATARADRQGRVRLRVPYATEAVLPARAEAPYRVWLGDEELRVRVSDAQVREGAVVALD